MALLLEKDKTYQVKVLNIEPMHRRPSFRIKNVTFYNFVLTIEMKDGTSGNVEYASSFEDIKKVPFVVGVIQWLKVRKCSELGCEVEPYDPEPQPATFDEKVELAKKLADPNYVLAEKPAPKIYLSSGLENTGSSTLSLSGNSLVFCLAYAKDILVAEIAQKPTGYQIDDVAMVERMFNMGTSLNDKLVAKIRQIQ